MLSDATKSEIVKGFFESGVVQFNFDRPFVLASGKLSPVYFDHRRISSFPRLRRQVTRAWATLLMGEFEKANIRKVGFAGTASAGIAPAFALAEFLDAGFVYVRGAPKKHGTSQCIEGALQSDLRYVVVDDMVTTAHSMLDAAQKMREGGAEVFLLTSITTHDLPGARQALKDVLYTSLFTSIEIFDFACESSLVNLSQRNDARRFIESLGD